MALTYDFDIFDLVPPGPEPDAATTGFMARLGLLARKVPLTPDSADTEDAAIGPNRVALFRDPATADALRDAPDGLRDYFLAAGFGLNTYASGAPRHRYPGADEQARLAVILALTALAPRHDLSGAEGDGAFRLTDFLEDLAQARPLPAAGPATPNPAQDNAWLATGTGPGPVARKIWHNRYVMIALAACAVLALVQATFFPVAITLAGL